MRLEVEEMVIGDILEYRVRIPPEVMEVALRVPGQVAVPNPHITLARFDDLGIVAKSSPMLSYLGWVEFYPEVYFVDRGDKQSCVIWASLPEQTAIRYAARITLDVIRVDYSALDPDRVFHVTLSNAGDGNPRASIGEPWKYSQNYVGAPWSDTTELSSILL